MYAIDKCAITFAVTKKKRTAPQHALSICACHRMYRVRHVEFSSTTFSDSVIIITNTFTL